MATQSSKSSFKATWTSIAVREGGAGNMVAEVNMDGHAQGFGPFIGTMTVTPAGADLGTWPWASICWLQAGGYMDITGQGRFVSDRPGHYTADGVLRDGFGRTLRIASSIDLATKSWEGTAEIRD